jgi:hypothetical protein
VGVMKKFLNRFAAFFNKKKFKHGALSVIMTAAFIAVIVLVNIVASTVLNTTFDLSHNQIFSIEQSTADFLAGLTDEVIITVFSRENDFINEDLFYNQTNEILRRFANVSPNVTLNYIDLLSNPDFAAQHQDKVTELRRDMVLVQSVNTGRERILGWEDYLHSTFFDLRTGNQITRTEHQVMQAMGMGGVVHHDVSAGAEAAFLSTIIAVTNVEPVYVGFTTGHGEIRNNHIEAFLELNAYDVHVVNLMTTRELSQDLDFLIIHTPSVDFAREHIDMIDEWLRNDGRLGKNLLFFAHQTANTPNLEAYLRNEWGVSVERSYVIQRDSQFVTPVSIAHMQMDIQYFAPFLFNDGLNPMFRIFGDSMRHTRQTFDNGLWVGVETEINTTPILSSYPGAVIVPFEELETFNSEAAATGAFEVGIQSSIKRYLEGEFDPVISNVMVFGGASVFAGELMVRANTNNAPYFMNMMNELSDKDTDIPTLTPRSFRSAEFEINRSQADFIGFIFAIALPLVLIVLGVVIWVRRIRS